MPVPDVDEEGCFTWSWSVGLGIGLCGKDGSNLLAGSIGKDLFKGFVSTSGRLPCFLNLKGRCEVGNIVRFRGWRDQGLQLGYQMVP